MPAPYDDIAGAVTLGIVPVDLDDRTAPLGCAALRRLRGRPLLHWAAAALTASGAVRRVLVAVPPALEGTVGEVLAGLVPDRLEVLPVRADGPGHLILAALHSPGARTGDLVVVHDPLQPLSSAALVRDVVRE